MMKLLLLGTGGGVPTDEAQTACYMLPEVGILLDAGTGLYRMPRHLQTEELDIYLTHAHGDHTRGLHFLMFSLFTSALDRLGPGVSQGAIEENLRKAEDFVRTIRVHASQAALDVATCEFGQDAFDWRLLHPQEALPAGGRLTTFSVTEKDELGFRLDWPGHSLAYVTDTTAAPDAKYIDAIRAVDLLVHDGCCPDSRPDLTAFISHSSPSAAAQVAASARVGRLILVHRNPVFLWSLGQDVENARRIFPRTELGMDGMEMEF